MPRVLGQWQAHAAPFPASAVLRASLLAAAQAQDARHLPAWARPLPPQDPAAAEGRLRRLMAQLEARGLRLSPLDWNGTNFKYELMPQARPASAWLCRCCYHLMPCHAMPCHAMHAGGLSSCAWRMQQAGGWLAPAWLLGCDSRHR